MATPILQPSADYAVGPLIDALLEKGDGTTSTVKIVLPGFVSIGTDGQPVDSAAVIAAIGSPDDAAWNLTDPSASLISIAKAIAINTEPPL